MLRRNIFAVKHNLNTVSFKQFCPHHQLGLAIHRQRIAIEHQFVLAADHVEIQNWQLKLFCMILQYGNTLGVFVEMKR